MFEKDLFEKAIMQIKKNYSELGHNLGWSFLYTPKNSFSRNTKLLFLPLNPAGSKYYDPVHSEEKGNAFRVQEDWTGNGKNLQKQVQLMFGLISERLNNSLNFMELMDSTLTANICPFRSTTWNELHNKIKTLEFVEQLWSEILIQIEPIVIINLSWTSHRILMNVYKKNGYCLEDKKEDKKMRVGWGNVTYSKDVFKKAGKDVTLIRLPHLSRYKIFGREESQEQVNEIVDIIVSKLKKDMMSGIDDCC